MADLRRYAQIVNSTAYNGWIQHAGGIGRLIEARGPWLHQSPQELILFESSRPMIVCRPPILPLKF